MDSLKDTKTSNDLETKKTVYVVRSFCQNYTVQEAREMARTKTNISDVFEFNSDDLTETKTFDTLGEAIAAFAPEMDYCFDSDSESEYFSVWIDTVEERIDDKFQEICEMSKFGTLTYDKYGQMTVLYYGLRR